PGDIIVGGDAVRHGGVDNGARAGCAHADADEVVRGLDTAELRLDGRANAGRSDVDALGAIVGDERVCDGKTVGPACGGPDATGGHARHDAVLDDQRFTGSELNSVLADAGPFDEQSAQADDIGRARGDRNPSAAGGDPDTGEAVPLNADRFVDGHAAVAGRV